MPQGAEGAAVGYIGASQYKQESKYMQNGLRYAAVAGSVLALIATSIPGVGADAVPCRPETRQGQLRTGGALDHGEGRQNDLRCGRHAALDGFGRPLLV